MLFLTDAVVKDIETVARAGMGAEGCARYVGVNTQTFLHWLEDGARYVEMEDAGQAVPHYGVIFAKLYRAYSRACAEREAEALLTVRKAQSGWQADAWWLEHMHPQYMSRENRPAADVVMADAAFLHGLRDGVEDDDDEQGGSHVSLDDSQTVSAYLRRLPGQPFAQLRDLPVGQGA